MGKKRQTDNQRLMAFGATADREALNTAIESLIAIRDARFAATTIKPPRKPRSDAGKARDREADDISSDKLGGMH